MATEIFDLEEKKKSLRHEFKLFCNQANDLQPEMCIINVHTDLNSKGKTLILLGGPPRFFLPTGTSGTESPSGAQINAAEETKCAVRGPLVPSRWGGPQYNEGCQTNSAGQQCTA